MLKIASPKRIVQALRNLRLDYLRQIFGFSFRHYPKLYWCLALMIISVMFEALAMNAFIPLSEIAAGKPPSQSNIVIQILSLLQLKSSSPKYIFLAFIVIFAFRIILQILGERMLMLITENLMPASLISQGLENVLCHTSIAEIERKSIGYYTSLSSEQVGRACNTVATVVRFSSFVVLISLYYYTIAIYSPITAIGVILFLGVSGVISFGILRKVHRLGVALTESSREGSSLFIDALNAVRSIRAFVAEEYVTKRFRIHAYIHKRHVFLIGFFSLLGKLFPMLLLVITFGLFILIGAQLSGAAFNYAFAVTLLIFLMRFFMAIGEAVNVFVKIVSDTKAGQDISEIITTRDNALVSKQTNTTIAITAPIRSLELRNISFAYTEEQPILKQFSMTFEAGKSYAIMGESGAGKSTLLDIILKFQEPSSGNVLLNGSLSLAAVEEKSVRQHIVLLGQETIIFNDTVRNNIEYGFQASEEVLRNAASLAAVEAIIDSLPEGYNTVLQYRGTNLSGGQRQRIGIARALLREPDVLVLDESMSALDPATKDVILKNILTAYRDKMVIFVSHDAAIRECVDVVIELRKLANLAEGEMQASIVPGV
ncbi:MAG: ABC transporter ATP-binding protein [Candidatus Kapaibacterium sp.]|nr:MAG: ABC transporter ATP-binding protein [Candidatus Kapabacteria bacterium]